MEQHPVPRNISGFQFHLIGDMTMRQFAYLVVGAILAFLFLKVGPFPVVIKFTFAGICGFTGFAFAFLPIQERPLDKWLQAFVKSINSPTQYVWHKDNPPPEVLQKIASLRIQKTPPAQIQNHNDALTKLHAYLKTLPPKPQQTLNAMEKSFVDKTIAMFDSPLVYTPGGTKLHQDVIKPIHNFPLMTKPAPALSVGKAALSAAPAAHEQIPVQKTSPVSAGQINPAPSIQTATPSVQTQSVARPQTQTQPSSLILSQQLSQIAQEKENLMKELELLKQQLKEIQKPQVVKPQSLSEVVKKAAPTIQSLSAKQAVEELGMPNLPQTPNIIIGVIKDGQRRILPNIILTVKDYRGSPLRAFKTNKLGQFASATPLPNGTYLLEVEDPLKRFVFDIAQITLSGKIFLPVEIIAKGEKEIMREKLTKEIFGSANS